MGTAYCQLCGKTTNGQGKLLRHSNWPRDKKLRVCGDCFSSKPRCSHCDIPLAAVSPNTLCITCAREGKICLTCGNPIGGRFWEVDGVGPYCQKCHRDRPPCDVCTAPLGDERWQLSDGRVFCSQCRNTGVFSLQEARELYDESMSVARRVLGLELNIPTGLVLVDRNQLAEVIQKQSDGANQLNIKKTMGIYARRGMKRGIYVQTGLPRLLFHQVASHEFAHAWQGENCPLLKDPLLHEGFAEWVAYRVLDHYGYKDQMSRMCERKDIYGKGLHMVLEMESTEGVAGVLDACRRSR